jgi:uncharacterized protein involved in exopolysaccharide biosynthesis
MTQARALLLSSVLGSLVAFGQTPALENQTLSPSTSRETVTCQIAIVETQLLEMRRTYTETHPEVRRLRGQLEVLQTQRVTVKALATERPTASVSVSRETVVHQIAGIESQLVGLRRIYTDSHPDVRRLQGQLQVLRTQNNSLTK